MVKFLRFSSFFLSKILQIQQNILSQMAGKENREKRRRNDVKNFENRREWEDGENGSWWRKIATKGEEKFPPAMHSGHYHIIDYAIDHCVMRWWGGGQAADSWWRKKTAAQARGRLENSNPSQRQQGPTHHFHRGTYITCFCCCKKIAAERDSGAGLLRRKDGEKKEE